MHRSAIVILLFIAALTSIPSANALVVLNGSGRRYPVVETSKHKELVEKIKADSRKVKKNRSAYTVTLTKRPEIAKEENIREITTAYIQPYDVVNRDGKVILAKGTRIEPLKYLKLPVIIVIEDNPAHLRWARKKKMEMEKRAKQEVFVLLACGSAWEIAKKYHMRVFHLEDRYMERFNIRRVPCIIRQKGLKLEVHEYTW